MSTLMLIIVALLGAAVVVVSWQPDKFTVSRSAIVPATPEAIFPFINNLHKWNEWSPWARLDPNCVNRYNDTPQGVGSSMSWSGNNKVGAGKMTVVESKPDELVRMRLEFEKPMKAVNTTEFLIRPATDGSEVVWTMSGTSNFYGKVMNIVMNCQKMIGGQFEQGFVNLREALAKDAEAKRVAAIDSAPM